MSFKVGDKVRSSAMTDIYGTSLASFTRTTLYTVIQVGGNGRPDSAIIIGLNGVITAVIDEHFLTLDGTKSEPTPVSEYIEPAVENTNIDSVNAAIDSITNSQGLEDFLEKNFYSQSTEDPNYLKYNMRLFGLPHQHTRYTDNRAYSPSLGLDTKDSKYVGRKFIENIMLEAPVITVIPGKPLYLPGAKDKRSITHNLLAGASGNLGALTTFANEQQVTEKLRYYDFQQDYYTYMKYVNILCTTSAALLDLTDHQIDGKSLAIYDWKNYRWNAEGYNLAVSNIIDAAGSHFKGFVDDLITYGSDAVNAAINGDFGELDNIVTSYKDNSEDDPDLLTALESILTQTNFVQFYVDPSSGVSESSDNATASSGLEGTIQGFEGLAKDFAFIMGSGGMDTDILKNLGNEMAGMNDAVSSYIANSGIPLMDDLGGLLDRIGGAVTNVIKGENMVFPEIYQNSKFTKNYSMTVNLKMVYGNRLSYYLNILVPLYHLLALAIPKQTTANSYGAPFIIKAYFPGVFSCNLGIVSSIQIEKCPTNSDGWTADGLPTEMRVTVNITDLYSDLSMTPTGDISLFLSNSSLIEYISTKCGVNMITPKLQERAELFINTLQQGFNIIDDEVNMAIFGSLENLIATLTMV